MSHTTILNDERRRAHKARNVVHSVVLIVGLAGLMSLCAAILWGWSGVLWGLAGAGLSFAIGPRVSPKMVMRMFRARPLDMREAGQLGEVIQVLTTRARLPAVPRLNLIPSATLNAFAVGKPDDAEIAVSSGLLENLSFREIAGVLAHEVSHIASNDLWIMGLADTFSRMTQIMSWFGVLLLLFNLPALMAGGVGVPWAAVALLYFAPTLGSLLQLALSRTREYDADLEGAELTGDPEALASALEKLERHQGRMWEDMFPTGRKIPIPSVLRSHPPTEERVRRLEELGPGDLPFPPLRSTGKKGFSGTVPLHPRPRYYWPGVWF
jgi:heat shock protein HtpX